jgi:hypothetical protein
LGLKRSELLLLFRISTACATSLVHKLTNRNTGLSGPFSTSGLKRSELLLLFRISTTYAISLVQKLTNRNTVLHVGVEEIRAAAALQDLNYLHNIIDSEADQ